MTEIITAAPPDEVVRTGQRERIDRLSVADFARLYQEHGGIELINGELIPVSPTVSGHNLKIRLIFSLLNNFVVHHNLGEVLTETTFVLPAASDSNRVEGSRTPDVMFISRENFDAFWSQPDADSKPFRFIPDLVVEVISPGDRYTDVGRKIRAYLADGVRLIWVVDMEDRTVAVYSPDQPIQILTLDDTLTGGAVLPGFAVVVREFFQSQSAGDR